MPGNWPGFFGIVIPLLETRLGIALILGALSLPAALLSLLALITYWSSDHLIVQYPIVGMLASVVMSVARLGRVFPVASLSRWR